MLLCFVYALQLTLPTWNDDDAAERPEGEADFRLPDEEPGSERPFGEEDVRLGG